MDNKENNCNISINQLMSQWSFFAKRYARSVSRIRYDLLFKHFPVNFYNFYKYFSEKILKNLESTPEDEIPAKSQQILDKLGEISNVIWKPSDSLEEDLEQLEQVYLLK